MVTPLAFLRLPSKEDLWAFLKARLLGRQAERLMYKLNLHRLGSKFSSTTWMLCDSGQTLLLLWASVSVSLKVSTSLGGVMRMKWIKTRNVLGITPGIEYASIKCLLLSVTPRTWRVTLPD